MISPNVTRYARLLGLAAGAMDFGTGLGLVFLPKLTLGLMFVPVPSPEALIYVRFVGTFVGAVGASYLAALAVGRRGDLQAVFRFTIPFRLAAGSFCAVAALTGALAPMWLSVTLADYGLVAAQTWLLRQAWGRDS